VADLTRRVALATCAGVPEGDDDAPALSTALGARGIESVSAVWSSRDVDWASFDLVVLRSTWDYAEQYDDFLAWLDRLPRLGNPAHVVRWSTDKRYLGELAAAGVAVTPTRYVEPGETFYALPGRFVIKPVVSAGGRRSASYRPERAAEAEAHVRTLHAEGRAAMVQPYLAGIDAEGETGLVYIGGSYSHAFRKGPLLAEDTGPGTGLFLEEEIEPRRPSPAERTAADTALAALPFPASELLYARVDVAPGPDGRPLVLEVELAEPSLYLWCEPAAADRFASAVATWLDRP
jgi:glutathione synthase/RimK-type ligase-like ATP-grasp enzyme